MVETAETMVERVARALWEQRRARCLREYGDELEEWGDGSIPKLNGVMEEARAAIEALRTPTQAMLDVSDAGERTTL